MEDGSTQRILASDFKAYDPFKDPKVITAATFHNTDQNKFVPDEYKANEALNLNKLSNVVSAHAAATDKYAKVPTQIKITTPTSSKQIAHPLVS